MRTQPSRTPPGDSGPVKERAVNLDVARAVLMAWIVIVIHGMFWLRLVPQPIASFALFEMPLIFMIAGGAYFLFGADKTYEVDLNSLMVQPKIMRSTRLSSSLRA